RTTCSRCCITTSRGTLLQQPCDSENDPGPTSSADYGGANHSQREVPIDAALLADSCGTPHVWSSGPGCERTPFAIGLAARADSRSEYFRAVQCIVHFVHRSGP